MMMVIMMTIRAPIIPPIMIIAPELLSSLPSLSALSITVEVLGILEEVELLRVLKVIEVIGIPRELEVLTVLTVVEAGEVIVPKTITVLTLKPDKVVKLSVTLKMNVVEVIGVL